MKVLAYFSRYCFFFLIFCVLRCILTLCFKISRVWLTRTTAFCVSAASYVPMKSTRCLSAVPQQLENWIAQGQPSEDLCSEDSYVSLEN